ncbi:Crp/Fnr family transcriptional regulator [Vibrio marisflavi]|uniref:Cyclic nucleotide-binding domain-containing protein n=1 Tax=Vibrio marisflavi CECT 7928 TaxID=634439 RepID=A0ABN8E008_9VIBR|nr:Crp/Fnr family transcriptional regulator [Vibrio marisflavi]CAH0536060.1 hypothetical protein VMF7928_00156 [Vibrio marisflavi CECT 7928]
MIDLFQQHLQKNGFAQQEIDQLIQSAKLIELPEHQALLHQGEVANDVFFMLEGICHSAYLTDKGKKFSKEFYWEYDWIIGFESLINQQASPYLIETITRCSILSLPIETLGKWRKERHDIYLKLLETQLMYKEKKERFMLLHTPEERYELFCLNFPSLLERLNDYQIAGYLGITPISLSRIKKRSQN